MKSGDLLVKYWNAVKLMKIIEAGTRLYNEFDILRWACEYLEGGKN